MIPIGTDLERRKLPKATLGLILVNFIVFGVELALPDDALLWTVQHFGFGPGNWNPLAPFTSLFLHGDIYHIAFNMLFLWIFGSPVEERIGSKAFLLFYFGGGLASGVLGTVMEWVARPDSTVPGIGASGAISTIMALFLYRCFYARLKMVISPILLPRQVSIPVIPLVLLWFFQNVLMGFVSLHVQTGVGHWAHVGGFVFGIAIGRWKRYGHEGQVEQLRARVLKKLEDGGWEAAEKDLLKLLRKAPDDPEVNHDLARLYAEKKDIGAAERHFTVAAQRFFPTQPLTAAYVALEHETALRKPMQIQYLVKAADALIKACHYEDACAVLSPIAAQPAPSGALAERGLTLFIKLAVHLNRREEAQAAARLFGANFPKSRYLEELKKGMKPGSVFPPAPAGMAAQPAPGVPGEEGAGPRSEEEKEADRLGWIGVFERVFADPAFWLILLALNIFTPFLLPRLYFSGLSPVYLFVLAFGMTVVHRMGSITEMLSLTSGPSEKDARREVELTLWYDRAVRADRGGNYADAVALYERVLAREKANIQARFNLARIYHHKLADAVKARLHYRALAEHTPEEHPFHSEAKEALKALVAPG
jgi:membrane associated rhomboid family serine protease/Tfp pilus assembly protein PilF